MAISRASLRALPFAHRVEFSRPVARVCLSATIAFLSGDLVLAGEVIAILVLGLSPDVTVTKLAAAGIIVTAIGTAGGVLALLLDAQDQCG